MILSEISFKYYFGIWLLGYSQGVNIAKMGVNVVKLGVSLANLKIKHQVWQYY